MQNSLVNPTFNSAAEFSAGDFLYALRADNQNDAVHVSFLPPKKSAKDSGRFAVEYPNVELNEIRSTDFKARILEAATKRCAKATELGAFYIVNVGENDKDKITDFVAVFCEKDDGLSFEDQHKLYDDFPLPTSARIESQKSIHPYWFLKPGCNKEHWRRIQAKLVILFGSDKALLNPNRLMRLPEFDHIRLVDNALVRCPVRCVQLDSSRRYGAYELESELDKQLSARYTDEGIQMRLDELLKTNDGTSGNLVAREYQLKQVPTKLKEVGERRQFILSRAGTYRAQGMDGDAILQHIRLDWELYCEGEPDEGELESIAFDYEDKETADTVHSVENAISGAKITNGLGKVGGFMLDNSAPLPESILPGVYPGFVTLLVSTNNVGKTKFLRNLSFSLCAGKSYMNLYDGKKQYRVAYFDLEDETTHTQHDCAKMVEDFGNERREAVANNLLYFIDEEIDGDALSLSNESHWEHINKRLEMFAPEVIVIDTLVAGFQIKNENDNAEMGALMKKLRNFARKHNAAVITAHHTAKPGENNQFKNTAISARGGSVLEDQARCVYTLDVVQPKNMTTKVVRLKGKKIKGAHIEDLYLDYDPTGKRRWFTEVNVDVAEVEDQPDPSQETLEKVFELINDSLDYRVSRAAAVKHAGVTDKTFDRRLQPYIDDGTLVREQNGDRSPVFYRLPANVGSH